MDRQQRRRYILIFVTFVLLSDAFHIRRHLPNRAIFTDTKTCLRATNGYSTSKVDSLALRLTQYLELAEKNGKISFRTCAGFLNEMLKSVGAGTTVTIVNSQMALLPGAISRVLKRSLLSELVIVGDFERAFPLLTQLIDEQVLNFLDLAAVSQVLQNSLRVSVDANKKIISDTLPLPPSLAEYTTTRIRREHRKQALAISATYAKLADLIQQNSWSGPAVDRVHEAGVRAYATLSEWFSSARALTQISREKLANEEVMQLSLMLLDKLSKIEAASRDSDNEGSGPNVDDLATEVALVQPLDLIPIDHPLQMQSILQLSRSTTYFPRAIEACQSLLARYRLTDAYTRSLPLSSQPETTQLILRELMDRGALVQDMMLVLEVACVPDMSIIQENGSATADAVVTILRAASLLSDRLKLGTSMPEDVGAMAAQNFAQSMVEIPTKVAEALKQTNHQQHQRQSRQPSLKLQRGRGQSPSQSAQSLSPINLSLSLLLSTLRRVGLGQEAWTVLQSIADLDVDSVWVSDVSGSY
jgi:hypothetical protein